MLKKIVNFFKEVKQELEKVNWPNKKQVQNYTIIVVVFSLAMAAFLGFVDMLLSMALKKII